MDLFLNILKKISMFDGVHAGVITLVTRTKTDSGDPGTGEKPTYSEVETTILGYIAPFEVRIFALVNAQEIDADFQLITNTDIDNIKTAQIKYNSDTYYIVRKNEPKLMAYQNVFVYFLRQKAGQD